MRPQARHLCGAGRPRARKRFDGVASFGRRPTFDNGAPLLEVFLFDFKGDLYGAALDVAFIGFIRDELKFDSIDALIRQMDDDSARARAATGRRAGRISEARGDRVERAGRGLCDFPFRLLWRAHVCAAHHKH